ncbi:MAG: type II secretion system F family protein [Candidatus Nanohaloarchaea archaeon]|nr:type II secretion system F family protein [Candidatus Nanohaloarchaea archaeon]
MGWIGEKLEFLSKDRLVQSLMPVAEKVSSLFPNLEKEIIQAEMDVEDTIKYLAESIFQALQLAVMAGIALSVVGYTLNSTDLYWYAGGLFPVIAIFGTFTMAKRPSLKAKRRTRDLRAELPYALRHILIEVESGISLYHSMVSVTTGYGEASKEFKRIVSDINAGKSEVEALEDAVLRNPSQEFRRALWQIINALKSGADVSDTLESLVDAILDKQIMKVERYGKELNPYTLMYMIAAIIIPSLGVTFMMILSSFTGMNISNSLFYMILLGLVIFQILFINIVKSKRPVVKV